MSASRFHGDGAPGYYLNGAEAAAVAEAVVDDDLIRAAAMPR